MATPFDKVRLTRLIDLLKPERRTRVVDVGANPINESPYGALLDAGLCDVWGFEPDARSYAQLSPSAHETYLPYAIGRGGPATLHVTRVPSLTSLLRPSAKTAKFFARFAAPGTVEEEVQLETHRIDDLEEVPAFDLLKIDVQGAETQVFEGAENKLAGAVAVISEVAFVPMYDEQPLLDEQMRHLRGLGYDLHKFLHLKGFSLRHGLATRLKKTAHGNQLLDGDAVFLRSLREPDQVDDEQLKHIAILADGVFFSFDVAVRCLDLLIERGVIENVAAEGYVDLLPDLAKPARVA